MDRGGPGPTPCADLAKDQRRKETRIVEPVGKRMSGRERVSSHHVVWHTSERRGGARLIDRPIGQGLHRPSAPTPQPHHRVARQRIDKHALGPGAVAVMLPIVTAAPRRLAHLDPIRGAIAAARIARRVDQRLD